MSFTSILSETIDLRSFSNLWYWIGLVVIWTAVTHRVLGVPFDMVLRAKRDGYAGDTTDDLVDLARIHVLRLLSLRDASWLGLVAGGVFGLTLLFVLGFFYGVEFAQACFLIALPLAAAFGLTLRRAQKILDQDPTPEQLCRSLTRHRMVLQGLGLASVCVTAVWGMFVNLTLPSWY